jgi:hypothetical protein
MKHKNEMKKTATVLALFVAALLAGLFVRYVMATKPGKSTEESDSETEKEGFAQREVGMPLDMQTVEGAVGVAGYNGTPPLLGSEPKPVSARPYEMANDTQLFSLANNPMSADCCPSPFSGDRGCICITDKQASEFATRGGNRSMKE